MIVFKCDPPTFFVSVKSINKEWLFCILFGMRQELIAFYIFHFFFCFYLVFFFNCKMKKLKGVLSSFDLVVRLIYNCCLTMFLVTCFVGQIFGVSSP